MTEPDKSRQVHELSGKQLQAIDLFLTGKTDSEVAQEIGVTRQTVNGWRHHDPVFMAALNARKAELWAAGVERFRQLFTVALGALEQELKNAERKGRGKLAIEILKMAGLDLKSVGGLGRFGVGPTDLDGILKERVRARKDILANIDLLSAINVEDVFGEPVTEEDKAQELNEMKRKLGGELLKEGG